MVTGMFHAGFAQELGNPIIITGAAGGQQFPDVAYNSRDNTFLVVWEDVLAENFYEIHGVLVNGESGQPLGEPTVFMAANIGIDAPEIAYNSRDNEFVVVARRRGNDMALARRISAQGRPVGEIVELGPSYGPTFFDSASRARVVSVVYNQTENQYFVGLGEPMTGQILFADLSLDLPVDQIGAGTNPAVAWSSVSNVYLMAWEDRVVRNTGSENLSAQLFTNTGIFIGDTILLRDQDFAEESPRVAYNPDDDQFLVVWDERIGFSEGLDPMTLTDTIGQIVSADGSLVGSPIPIEAGTAYTLRQDVDYSSPAGLYLVVWKGDESGDFAFADIFGRLINRDGSFASDAFLIYDAGDDNTDEGTSEQYYDESKLPVVAVNTNTGAFFVVWEEAGTTRNPDDRDIMARFVAAQPSPVGEWMIL